MEHIHNTESELTERVRFGRSLYSVVVFVIVAVVAYFLLIDNPPYIIAVLPFSLLLMCPLMYFFMGHQHKGKDRDHESQVNGECDSEQPLITRAKEADLKVAAAAHT